jgi:hypothetical protein
MNATAAKTATRPKTIVRAVKVVRRRVRGRVTDIARRRIAANGDIGAETEAKLARKCHGLNHPTRARTERRPVRRHPPSIPRRRRS